MLSNLFLFVSCTFCKLFLAWILNHKSIIKTKYDQSLSWNDLYLIMTQLALQCLCYVTVYDCIALQAIENIVSVLLAKY